MIVLDNIMSVNAASWQNSITDKERPWHLLIDDKFGIIDKNLTLNLLLLIIINNVLFTILRITNCSDHFGRAGHLKL